MRLSDDARTLWETAQALNRAAAAVMPGASALPPLIFMTDPARTPYPWETAARLPRGAAVIHRGFGRPEAAETAARLRQATRAAGVRLLIAADTALALAIEADGLHLPERDLARGPAVRAAHPNWLLTGAAHGAGALAQGGRAGLDALILSPVFAPGGASGGEPLNPKGFGRLARGATVPVYALGGLTASTAAALAESGACGIAAVQGVTDAFA